jgi:hypothetical protein
MKAAGHSDGCRHHHQWPTWVGDRPLHQRQTPTPPICWARAADTHNARAFTRRVHKPTGNFHKQPSTTRNARAVDNENPFPPCVSGSGQGAPWASPGTRHDTPAGVPPSKPPPPGTRSPTGLLYGRWRQCTSTRCCAGAAAVADMMPRHFRWGFEGEWEALTSHHGQACLLKPPCWLPGATTLLPGPVPVPLPAPA